MGLEDRNNRVPKVVGDTYRWDYSAVAGVTVSHKAKSDTVTVEYLGEEVKIPRRQSQWLAEVLLQVADLYRVAWTEEGRDDYNRPDLAVGDRR